MVVDSWPFEGMRGAAFCFWCELDNCGKFGNVSYFFNVWLKKDFSNNEIFK